MEIELPYPQSTQPFDGWYTKAGVRRGARRLFSQEQEEGRVFFPPELISYFSHEVVRGLPAPRLRELTIRHLYHVLCRPMTHGSIPPSRPRCPYSPSPRAAGSTSLPKSSRLRSASS